MNFRERIAANPDVLMGKLVIRGTRIVVEDILRRLAARMAVDELLEAYSHLRREDVLSALAYSAEILVGEELIVP